MCYWKLLPLTAPNRAFHLESGLPWTAAWARDIPLEAFGPGGRDVVTAPSATHLYCMRFLQRRGALEERS